MPGARGMYTSFGMGSPSKRVETLSGEAAQKWHYQQQKKVRDAFTFSEDRKDRQAIYLLSRRRDSLFMIFPVLQVTRVIPVIDLIVAVQWVFWTLHLF